MTINEALTKQSLIVALKLKDKDNELSKELMVKIMKARIQLNKVRAEFEKDLQEAANGFQTEDFKKLQSKQKRTKKEEDEFQDMINKINSEMNEFISKYVQDEASNVGDISFTDKEYEELIPINADVETDFNGIKLNGPDFLETIYNIFVKEDKK